jgi:hypothetical protein
MSVRKFGKYGPVRELERPQEAEIDVTITMPVHVHHTELEKSVVTVGNIRRSRVKVGFHLSRVVVAALLRFVGIGKAGS